MGGQDRDPHGVRLRLGTPHAELRERAPAQGRRARRHPGARRDDSTAGSRCSPRSATCSRAPSTASNDISRRHRSCSATCSLQVYADPWRERPTRADRERHPSVHRAHRQPRTPGRVATRRDGRRRAVRPLAARIRIRARCTARTPRSPGRTTIDHDEPDSAASSAEPATRLRNGHDSAGTRPSRVGSTIAPPASDTGAPTLVVPQPITPESLVSEPLTWSAMTADLAPTDRRRRRPRQPSAARAGRRRGCARAWWSACSASACASGRTPRDARAKVLTTQRRNGALENAARLKAPAAQREPGRRRPAQRAGRRARVGTERRPRPTPGLLEFVNAVPSVTDALRRCAGSALADRVGRARLRRRVPDERGRCQRGRDRRRRRPAGRPRTPRTRSTSSPTRSSGSRASARAVVGLRS